MKFSRRTIIKLSVLASAHSLGAVPALSAEFKAAIVMPGNITDQAHNQVGYEAILQTRDLLGIEVAFSEKVAQPDQLEAVSDYARRGYNLVVGHGGEFADAAQRAAKRFPKTFFLVVNGFVSDKNLASLTFDLTEFGYVFGVMAAKLTKTKKVGFISGQKIRVATDYEKGFRQGYRNALPDGEILVGWTNDWDDVAKAKEATLNLINQGADVVLPLLDNGQVGALQACQQKKVWGFGVWKDAYPSWKDTVVQSAVLDLKTALVEFITDAKNGKVEGKVYKVGVGTHAGHLGEFNPQVPEAIVTEAKDIVGKIRSAEIKVQ